jgi:hypothetical protein
LLTTYTKYIRIWEVDMDLNAIVAGANLGDHPPSLFTAALKRHYGTRGKRIKVMKNTNST